jgi:methyl-accepting chemotaxis protein
MVKKNKSNKSNRGKDQATNQSLEQLNQKKKKIWRRIPIGVRLLSSFAIVIIMTVAIGIIGVLGMQEITAMDRDMYENMTVPMNDLIVMTDTFQRIRGDLKDIIMTEIDAVRNDYADVARANADVFLTTLDNYEKTLFSDEGKQLVLSVRENFTEYMNVAEEIITLSGEHRGGEAIYLMNNKGAALRTAIDEDFDRMIEIKLSAAQETVDNNTQIGELSAGFVLVLLITASVIALILAVTVSISITRPIKKTLKMIQNMAKGRFDMRVDSKSGDQVGKMADAMDMFAMIMQQGVFANMRKIAEGDVSMNFPKMDEKDEITPALQMMVDSIKAMTQDTDKLVQAAVAGELGVRADASVHQGEYRRIIEGMNSTMDAVVRPLNEASTYVQGLAAGEADKPLENKYEGDYARLIDDINRVQAALQIMKTEMDGLVAQAIRGHLGYRADVSRLQGDYAEIVQGVNDSLDAIAKPVEEASQVLSAMAEGELDIRVTGDYQGDHAKIKNALNNTLDAVQTYIAEISHVLTEISQGNLELSIDREYLGDFGEIKRALNLIIMSLNSIIGEISNAADQVASGSRQVSEGSQSLSQGTTEQASSIQELTATITEIAAQTRQNATNANEANQLASKARENAIKGNQQMQHMIEAMTEISTSSSNISKIIKVIDDIAFQTNILALNAAVEAARAGQHGKGFAVVAEEVRNLAARSAEAARETTVLIEGSIQKVGDGNEIALETGKSLDMIVEDISRTDDLIDSIANASNEQASGLAQINEGVVQVSNVVQANSATSEQSAAASEELSSQAQLLKELTGSFKLAR